MLERLLLSKEQHGRKGRERGYISYAELGINQLGAVYEGLMSYSGFFATEDLYEVAHDGNPQKGSWVVPLSRAHDIAQETSSPSSTTMAHDTRASTGAASSSSASRAGPASSRPPITPPRC
ncbi:type II restriction enzyme [Cutibacterium acnes JCM 18916]|nr:type II restriction enzyme [Cutibacterium acnes JCM 18916]